MCGIAGFIDSTTSTGTDRLRAEALAMSSTIAHRGPDDAGVFTDADAGIALASRRLAILDLSPAGHQPMESADGRYVLVFNGEIYNFRDVRRDLEKVGHGFRGTSDTEVLLEAIARWGLDQALTRANGMFAFALWDRAERRLHLARDGVGEKPLYYGWFGDTFVFASELKAMRVHPGFEGSIDRDALALFLRLDYIPAPFTIYRSIDKLPAGSTLVVDPTRPGRTEIDTYWDMAEVAVAGTSRPLPDDVEAREELDRLLSDAVRMRMESDVPLGAFLSGGIDSSTIVALMQAHSSAPTKTFTIGFQESGYDEARSARAVAEKLDCDHTELYVSSEDALEVIPDLPAVFDEPFADPSQVPTYLLARLARTKVTVALSGDGGDELFGGYPRYLSAWRRWRSTKWMPGLIRRPLGDALSRVSSEEWDSLYGRVAGRVPRLRDRRPGARLEMIASTISSRDLSDPYLRLISMWPQPGDVAVDAHEHTTAMTDPRRLPRLRHPVHQMMLMDAVTYLPDDILVKVDRTSMAVGLEARVPLLDPRVVEYAWRLPPPVSRRVPTGKAVIRDVLARYVPMDLFDRPKMGFELPVDPWLRGPLKEWSRSMLDSSRLRQDGYLNSEPIIAALDEHEAGRDRGRRIWNALMFQGWLESARSTRG